jgi:hypothetical protein
MLHCLSIVPMLTSAKLAKAGFFYYPILVNPDNVACFLCHKNIDGWEKGDDPQVEHLKHSPDCGWAIVATIEKQDGQLSEEYPCSTRMIEARKATFADKWPHEGKKGWKCKVKQVCFVDSLALGRADQITDGGCWLEIHPNTRI